MNVNTNFSQALTNAANLQSIVTDYLAQYVTELDPSTDLRILKISEIVFKYIQKQMILSKDWQYKVLDEEEKLFVHSLLEKILISAENPWQSSLDENQLSDIQKLAFRMIKGQMTSINEWMKSRYLESLIWKKDSELLMQARYLVQQLLEDLFQQIIQNDLSEQDEFYFELMIADLLALYPYLDPQTNESLQIPVYWDGQWQFIDYKVEQILLTPSWMGSPLVAIGLISQEDTHPLLLFKGTTYPTDEGFGLSVLMDINPMASVGHYGIEISKQKIFEWLSQSANSKKAVICGKSLGGALACKTALYFSEYVEKVIVFGAPGFSKTDLKTIDQLIEANLLPSIHVFCQDNDIVPSFDWIAKQGIHYYQMINKEKKGAFASHVEMYSMHENVSVLQIDPTHENKQWKRRALTILRHIASFLIFPICALLLSGYTFARYSVKFLNKRIRQYKFLSFDQFKNYR